MNILQICSKPPFPKKDGYALAINHISNALINKGHSLKVIAISTPKHDSEDVPTKYLSDTNFEHIFIDTSVKILPAFQNLFSKSSYNTNRFYSENLAKRLKQILAENNFDIVLLEGLSVCPYFDVISKNSKAKIVLRAHNVESDIWKGLVEQESNFIKKWYLNFLQKKLCNYEKSMAKKMNSIITISERDKEWFAGQTTNKMTTIPFAITTDNAKELEGKPNTIFHIGSMDWKANQDGVNWFLKKVFPLVNQKKKDVVLHLAGRSMPDYFHNFSNKNIIIDGEIKSAKEFMQTHNLMIAPLLNGSGIRIKILEGMAMGKTIVSTTIGASGIECQHKKNILIADTEKEFSNQIIWCLNNPVESRMIGENAKVNIQENYNTKKISEQLDSFLNQIQKS